MVNRAVCRIENVKRSYQKSPIFYQHSPNHIADTVGCVGHMANFNSEHYFYACVAYIILVILINEMCSKVCIVGIEAFLNYF